MLAVTTPAESRMLVAEDYDVDLSLEDRSLDWSGPELISAASSLAVETGAIH